MEKSLVWLSFSVLCYNLKAIRKVRSNGHLTYITLPGVWDRCFCNGCLPDNLYEFNEGETFAMVSKYKESTNSKKMYTKISENIHFKGVPWYNEQSGTLVVNMTKGIYRNTVCQVHIWIIVFRHKQDCFTMQVWPKCHNASLTKNFTFI